MELVTNFEVGIIVGSKSVYPMICSLLVHTNKCNWYIKKIIEDTDLSFELKIKNPILTPFLGGATI